MVLKLLKLKKVLQKKQNGMRTLSEKKTFMIRTMITSWLPSKAYLRKLRKNC